MNNPCNELCPECVEVKRLLGIDVEHLFRDLSKFAAKSKLTEQEKSDLCLSLMGEEPIEIAKKLYCDHFRYKYQKNQELNDDQIEKLIEEDIKKQAGHIRTRISKTINSYIMELILEKNKKWGESLKQRPSWAKIICFLIANGYKRDFDLVQERRIGTITYKEDFISHANIVKLFDIVVKKLGEGSLVLKEFSEEGDKNESK